ncbi:GDSL esterase/lipase At5g33370 [Linum grandiflorum]
MASSILALTTIIAAAIAGLSSSSLVAAGGRRAIFAFGSSECDTGNNNYLATKYRADFPPYGIDFYPTRRPTGRFSNGRILLDSISQRLGLGYILPYLSPDLNGEWLLRGASFASAGVGIWNATSVQFGYLIRIYQQFLYFEQYRRRVVAMIGEEETQYFIEKSIFIISHGSADFLNYYYNYMDDKADRSPADYRSQYDGLPDEYVTLLLLEFKKILIRMYELGGRRILVEGPGPVGCYPKVLAAAAKRKKSKGDSGRCDEKLQSVVAAYNAHLMQLTTQLNSDLGSQAYFFVNVFSFGNDINSNPRAYGFATSRVACCGQGAYNGEGPCTVASDLCPDRDVYVFWDSIHPTQRVVELIADQIFYGSADVISPMNLSTIMAVDRWG